MTQDGSHLRRVQLLLEDAMTQDCVKNCLSSRDLVFRGPKFGVVNLGFRYALWEENGATSAVHSESPPLLIVQTKGVLKSQGADLQSHLVTTRKKPGIYKENGGGQKKSGEGKKF